MQQHFCSGADIQVPSTGVPMRHDHILPEPLPEPGDPNVYGDNGNNTLRPNNFANNFLFGYGGNDVLYVSQGADYFDGGDGFDFVSYAGGATGVTVNLTTGLGAGGAAHGDRYVGIEGVYGSNHHDTLTSVDRGGGNGAELQGLGRDDYLI